MQYVNQNPPIRSVCSSINTATAANPIFIIGASFDGSGDSSNYKTTPYNISTWCRELSDGTIMQGAYTVIPQSSNTYTSNTNWSIQFMKPYKTTNINVMVTPVFNGKATVGYNGGFCPSDPDQSYFTLFIDGSSSKIAGCYWEATGV